MKILPHSPRSLEKGFTFIEIILTMGIFVVLGTMSAVFYSRFLTQTSVGAIQSQLVSTFRKAHTYAITSRVSSASGWGVHYDSATKKVTLFQGLSYASRNSALDEVTQLPSTISLTGFTDVVYDRVTGNPTFYGTALPTPTPTIAGPTPTPAPAAWYDANWRYRRQITIDRTKVLGTLANFPVLIKFATDANLAAHALTTGNDILFTSSDGITKIPHEIEKYVSSTGEIEAWVQVPVLSSAGNTILYLYYGNAAATNQQQITATWDTNYKLIHHLNETSGMHQDSTTNANNATAMTVTTQGSAVGQIDGADDFNASTNRVSIPDTTSLEPGAGDFTVSAWVKIDTLPSVLGHDSKIVYKDHSASPWVGYELWFEYPDNTIRFEWTNGTSFFVSNSTVAAVTGTWYYVTGVKSGTTTQVYINGSTTNTTPWLNTTGSVFNSDLPLVIGNDFTSDNRTDGIIDEVRYATVARTSSWIASEYNNQVSPQTFYAVNAEETYSLIPTATPILPTSPPANTVTITISSNNGQTKQVTINGVGVASQ